MHEALLSDIGPNSGHITHKVVLNLLFPIYLFGILPIESFCNVALICLLPVFLVRVSFPDAPSDLCDGLHGQHDFFSKNLGHNGLSILKLSIPPEHPDELWIYLLWIIEVSINFAEK